MISKPLFRTGDEVHAFFDDDTPCTVVYVHAVTLSNGLLLVAYSVDGQGYDMTGRVAAPETTEAKRIQPFLKWREEWI